jgi:hypothetical protein
MEGNRRADDTVGISYQATAISRIENLAYTLVKSTVGKLARTLRSIQTTKKKQTNKLRGP